MAHIDRTNYQVTSALYLFYITEHGNWTMSSWLEL